ncbi:MAG TPA: GNAT family N-acetyltransferase [Anaerolineae bacterium]|nr:GNAT family N-acetyltransferase [Anaerolineae bacterium]HMR67204.1 GNAT family N-acetyltransferase [Anaerolineae bacterium]
MDIKIRPINTLTDLRKCHEIQRTTWGFTDLMVFPYTQLISAAHNGGVLLGAYDGPELVGFVYGYLGMSGSKLYLFSQRMGVLPKYQSQGIGTKLKLAQRDQMLRQGIDLIVWTYDPLLGKNANLNIEKLGGIVRHYARDIYGAVNNPLQIGLSTDRFLLEWELMSARVRERIRTSKPSQKSEDWINHQGYEFVNYAAWDGELPRPVASDLELDSPVLLVQIPPDLNAIKRVDLGLARGWRESTRDIFETYFKRGYVITGFARSNKSQMPNIYKMEIVSMATTSEFPSWVTGVTHE